MIIARIRDGLRVNTSGIGILHTDYSMYVYGHLLLCNIFWKLINLNNVPSRLVGVSPFSL